MIAAEKGNENTIDPKVGDEVVDHGFLISHYQTLRHEMLSKVDQIFNLIKFALITHGGIWAWLLTESDKIPASSIAMWFPLLISLLFSTLYVTIRIDIGVLGAKMHAIEKHFCLPVEMAWERDTDFTYTRTKIVHYVIWCVLVFANIGLVFWL